MKKGPLYEKRLADYFTAQLAHLGIVVIRRVMGGINDKGDLYGIPDWTIEAKCLGSIKSLGAVMNELAKEMRNAGTRFGAAVLNRRSHALERSYAVLELWQLAELVASRIELERIRRGNCPACGYAGPGPDRPGPGPADPEATRDAG